jgi:hypothetical protein
MPQDSTELAACDREKNRYQEVLGKASQSVADLKQIRQSETAATENLNEKNQCGDFPLCSSRYECLEQRH